MSMWNTCNFKKNILKRAGTQILVINYKGKTRKNVFGFIRLQSKDNEGEDKRRAKKDKPKTIIEGPVRRWTPKRGKA